MTEFVDDSDGFFKLRRFVEEVFGAQLQASLPVGVMSKVGEHDDTWGWSPGHLLDHLQDFHSTPVGHRNIQQDDVRPQAADLANGLCHPAGFPNNLHAPY